VKEAIPGVKEESSTEIEDESFEIPKVRHRMIDQINIEILEKGLEFANVRKELKAENCNEIIKSKACDCEIEFKDKTHRMYHTRIVHKNYFKCEICVEAFKTEAKFKKHISSHSNPKEEQQYPKMCDQCGFVATYKGSLRKHKQFKHDYSTQTCEICSKGFSGTFKLRLHMNRIHKNGNKCCRQVFEDKGDLKIHISRHIKQKSNLLKCDECDYTGKTKYNVTSHRKLRHDSQTHVCDICSTDFNGLIKLQVHRRRFHSESIACLECDEYFKRSNMSRHMLKAHTKDNEKKYQCDKCGRGFIDITRYSVHMISAHTNEKPFACRYSCGHATNDPTNRNKHEKEKHGRKFQ